MSADFFQFEWPVPKDGYRWKVGRSVEQLPAPKPLLSKATDDQKLLHKIKERNYRERTFLVDPDIRHSELNDWQWTFPLRDLRFDLHQKFANVPPTPDGIMKFANKHGRLGGDLTETLPIADPESGVQFIHHAEREEDWLDEITAMCEAVQIWDTIREKRTANLNPRYKRQGDITLVDMTPFTLDEHRKHFILVPSKNSPRAVFDQVKIRDSSNFTPAILALQKIINQRLAEKNRVATKLRWNLDTKKLELYGVPTCLIGAIWLDLALAIIGNIHYRNCEHTRCRQPFAVPPKARKKKLFCSDKCRVAVSRNPELRAPSAAD